MTIPQAKPMVLTARCGELIDTVNYTYGDTGAAPEIGDGELPIIPWSDETATNPDAWRDLLTAYDGNAITYDGIGNPLTWGNRTFTWEHGRQLASLTENGTTWSYTYGADGLRIGRTNGTTTYSYVYNGSQLVQMTVGTNTLRFTYDAAGTPLSVNYNGTTYYYVTNIQGDVVAIVNASGVEQVRYTYGAWGQLLSTTGTLAATLGADNPLRYRGYVYDTEAALYYLQSRYYDPTAGRFINADAMAATGQGFVGNNMFAYCLNNPIVFADYDGREAGLIEWWIGTFGWLFVADGPAVVGDAIVVLGIMFLSLFEAERNSQVVAPSQPLEEEKKDDKDQDKNDSTEIPDVTYPGNDPSIAPGDDYEWKGKLPEGGDKGAWVNKNTGEQWHPDLDHKLPKGPHWDYTDIFGNVWSVFENGRIIIWK